MGRRAIDSAPSPLQIVPEPAVSAAGDGVRSAAKVEPQKAVFKSEAGTPKHKMAKLRTEVVAREQWQIFGLLGLASG